MPWSRLEEFALDLEWVPRVLSAPQLRSVFDSVNAGEA